MFSLDAKKALFVSRRRVVLPCNGCTECCKGEALYLHPECGDDASQYLTQEYEGRLILQHKPNGDCAYLGESGCTIHGKAPAICQEHDCRLFLRRPDLKSQFPARRWRALVRAAKKLDKRVRKALDSQRAAGHNQGMT